VYLDDRPTEWPPPDMRPTRAIEVDDVQFSTLLDEVAMAAIHRVEPEVHEKYHGTEDYPLYHAVAVRDSGAEPPELIPFPRMVPDPNGEAIWTGGGRSQITVGDLARARERGFFDGDPTALFLEPPVYGGEALPGWEELFHWLGQLGKGVTVALFVAVIRSGYEHWRSRGAFTPFVFLDLVVSRQEWDVGELAQLLRISDKEERDLLISIGFEESTEPGHWTTSSDPKASELRKKIIEDYLHRPYDGWE